MVRAMNKDNSFTVLLWYFVNNSVHVYFWH